MRGELTVFLSRTPARSQGGICEIPHAADLSCHPESTHMRSNRRARAEASLAVQVPDQALVPHGRSMPICPWFESTVKRMLFSGFWRFQAINVRPLETPFAYICLLGR